MGNRPVASQPTVVVSAELTSAEALRRTEEAAQVERDKFEQNIQAEHHRAAEEIRRVQVVKDSVAIMRKNLLGFSFQTSAAYQNLSAEAKHACKSWGIRNVIVGLFGQSGSGKTSFIGTIDRALRLSVMGALSGHTYSGEGTLILMDYFLDQRFRMMDTRGFTAWDALERRELARILLGELSIAQRIDRSSDTSGLTFAQMYTQKAIHGTNPETLVHVMVMVCDIKDPRLIFSSSPLAVSFSSIKSTVDPLGLPRIVVLTHRDMVSDAVAAERAAAASIIFSCSAADVFMMQNYTDTFEESKFESELSALTILYRAVTLGAQFLAHHVNKMAVGN